MPASKSFVYIFGPIAPPIQGAAAMTGDIAAYMQDRAVVRIGNISPGTAKGVFSKLLKPARVIMGLGAIIKHAPRRNKVLYMACDGGYGRLYNIASAFLARLMGYRIFLHHHSFAYIDRKSRIMALLARVMGRHATHIVLCDLMAHSLRARYPDVQITLTMLGPAFMKPNPRDDIRRAAIFRMGFLSNLIVEKGLDTCIDLLRAARLEGLPVQLVLAGRSPGQASTQLVEAAKTEFGTALEYLGPLPEDEKKPFYLGLDAFVFPTRYVNEAQPRAVLDALAYGIPVMTMARSCITGDVGAGGVCIPMDADFVAQSLPVLRSWCQDAAVLASVSQAAAEQAVHLHRDGLGQLAVLAEAMGAVV